MAAVPQAITYEQWLTMPEVSDGVEEVIDGEIRILPPPKLKHTYIVENLSDAFKAQLARREFRVFVGQFGLVIRRDPLRTRVPDLAICAVKNMVGIDESHTAEILLLDDGANRREGILMEGQLRPKHFPHVCVEISEICHQ